MTEKEKRAIADLNWLGSQKGGLPAYKRRICEEAVLLLDRLLPGTTAEGITAADRIRDAGYDDVLILENYSYDDALIGVTEDGRAVYDFNKMVSWLMQREGWSALEAMEWIEFNTIGALPYAGDAAPIIIYPV